MAISPNEKSPALAEKLTAFMNEHVYAAEAIYHAHVEGAPNRWKR